MKGDFTRFTFDPERRFTGVLKQQGRVDLDADWNEQLAIQRFLEQVRLGDIIGAAGAPKGGGGFALAVAGTDLTISAGRLYVGRLLCEAEEGTTYDTQPFFPAPPALAPEDGRTDLLYVAAWERHVSALQEPELREVALGGPDTTTRLQTVWQVRALAGVGDVDCGQAAGLLPSALSAGRLTVESEESPPNTDPCTLTPVGGFRGLENQLYRIEIHEGGALGAATFKWSRENGSVQFRVSEFLDGLPTDRLRLASLGPDDNLTLHIGDWVEVLDDDGELQEGRGTLAEIIDLDEDERVITLDRDLDGLDLGRAARVIRWDQGSDALPTGAGPFALEDGIQVRFGGGPFRAGDWWAVAARTTTGTVESFADRAPMGEGRQSAALALVTWHTPDGGETWTADIDTCLPDFPPLTDISADDVSFDDANCQLGGAETVQEALDLLCQQRDLRHHNRHLHGWGIVCGLQVHCGPNEGEVRRFVTVRDGYALDCEGNDILLDGDMPLDVLEMIRQWPGEPILDAEGNGDVSLILDRGPTVRIVPYERPSTQLRDLLRGTLLMDYYQECIQPLVDFARNEFTIPPEEEGRPAGPAQERIAAFTNLMAQPVNPTTGQHIFLSRREHVIIRDFYVRLRALLQSNTYCAMFDDARPFPDYPDEMDEAGMDTAFGKSFHNRLRLRPNSREGFTVGSGLNPLKPSGVINRFDLAERRLISQIDPLAGLEEPVVRNDSGGGEVLDVAFSPDGRRIYVAVSSRDQASTFFRQGRVTDRDIRWDPTVMVCNARLLTLAVTPADPGRVYAVGQQREVVNGTPRFLGTGLYRINPDEPRPDLEPLVPFNAKGHLVITDDGVAYATASVNANDPHAARYSHILAFQVPSGEARGTLALPGSGDDDLAVTTRRVGRQQQRMLFTVFQQGNQKMVAGYVETANQQYNEVMRAAVGNSDIRLAGYPATNTVLVTASDSYAVQLIDLQEPHLVEEYLLPMQVAPMAIAVAAGEGREGAAAYVLNSGSNTITTIERRETLAPAYRFPLDVLAAYRAAILNAFIDLLGGLLQYLKDCLCDHFLVDCPTCEEEEPIFLGAVSIRDNEVERVCNFSQRRYVKSFPTVGYWLSLVPIMPLVDRLIEQFCCAVLPNFFQRQTVQPAATRYDATHRARVSTPTLFNGAAALRNMNLTGRLRTVSTAAGQARTLAGDRFRNVTARAPETAIAPSASAPIVGQTADRAATTLEEKGIRVTREPFDPTKVGSLTTLFRTPPEGSEVTLFEENGQVKYYAIKEPAREAAAPQELLQLREAVTAREQEVATLRAEQQATGAQLDALRQSLSETQGRLTLRDSELVDIRERIGRISGPGRALDDDASAEIAALRGELEELRAFRAEVERFMRGNG